MKKWFSILLAAVLTLGFCACAPVSARALGEMAQIEVPEIAFPEQTVPGRAESADTTIQLSGSECAITGGGAQASGSEITITEAGAYLISGDWNGAIIVDVEAEKKTVLYLNGASIKGASGAAIWVKSEPKNATIYLCEGSVNLVEDAETYAYDASLEDIPSAAIYSREDLKFQGEGALYVKSHAQKGIQSKDDIEIEGGQIYVIAADDGIRGKDSVSVSGGEVHIQSGADGLRANNDTDEGKGVIAISGGEVYILAEQDGMQAVTSLTISGGTVAIECGGGSANSSTGETGESWGNWGMGGGKSGRGGMTGGRGGFGGDTSASAQVTDAISAKGAKAEGSLSISGGRVSINSSDDALHTNGNMQISAGEIFVTSGDDGMHADQTLAVSGGWVEIEKSYEGIEAEDIQISGGVIRVTASDDGLNAAGGEDASSVNGRAGQNWGRGMMDNGVGSIEITGGYLVINASGDGIDSNGTVSMSGGTAIVYGPTNNGNGALDYGTSFTFTGGTLLAVGSSGMAQSVSASGAGVLAFTCQQSANTLLQIIGEDGSERIAFSAPKAYSCVIFASDQVKSGETCAVYAGGEHTGEATDGVYEAGTVQNAEKLGTLTAN